MELQRVWTRYLRDSDLSVKVVETREDLEQDGTLSGRLTDPLGAPGPDFPPNPRLGCPIWGKWWPGEGSQEEVHPGSDCCSESRIGWLGALRPWFTLGWGTYTRKEDLPPERSSRSSTLKVTRRHRHPI